MKKIVAVLLSVFALLMVLSFGCSKKSTPTSPTATGGAVKITASIQTINNSGMIYGAQYGAAILDGAGNTISGATVTVSSSNGTQVLTEPMPGVYLYQGMMIPQYLEAQDYTITVNVGAVTYTATAKAPGGLTLAADGSSASWTSEGTGDMLTIMYPSGTGSQILGPDLSSPYNITATGAYTHGSGSYTLTFIFVKQAAGVFNNGASTLSTVTFQDEIMTQLTK